VTLKYTMAAFAFLRLLRAHHDRPTWFDVTAAYDAGLKHALENRESARRAVAMRDKRQTESESE
jgi:hypothetical protein